MSLRSLYRAIAAVPCPIPRIPEPCSGVRYSTEHGGDCAYFTPSAITTPIESIGVPYHDNKDALYESAKTCSLCKLILGEIEDHIGRQRYSLDETIQNWRFRLVARGDGVDGFTLPGPCTMAQSRCSSSAIAGNRRTGLVISREVFTAA